MARGSVVRRCRVCRQEGKTGYAKCSHKQAAVYSISYRVGGKQKWQTIGSNKKDAERLLVQRISEINNGTHFKPSDISFQEFSLKWLEAKKLRVKPSTYRGYKGDLKNHIIPILKYELLSTVTREKVEDLLNAIRNRRSAATVNNVRLLILMIFNHAKSFRYVSFNPVEEIKPFPIEFKEMDFLNPDEIRLLINHAEKPFKMLFMTAILTGMRKGELFGLQWGDIDWFNNSISVRRSLFWCTKNEIGKFDQRWRFIEPKSKSSKRSIIMSPKLKEELETYRLTAMKNQYDLVFCNKKGNPLDPKNLISRAFDSTLRFAGLRKIRFHDLRHTFATLMINQCENPKFIQRQMGHSSIQITMDTYGHIFPINQYDVGAKLDRQIFIDDQVVCL